MQSRVWVASTGVVVLLGLALAAARAQPTPREVVLLRGLARQVQWAGRNLARGGMANT